MSAPPILGLGGIALNEHVTALDALVGNVRSHAGALEGQQSGDTMTSDLDLDGHNLINANTIGIGTNHLRFPLQIKRQG